MKWYRKSAEQGNPDGQIHLGDCYLEGKGVKQDYVEAVKWYRKSAELNTKGKIYLAVCYLQGIGVNQDYTEAVKLINRLNVFSPIHFFSYTDLLQQLERTDRILEKNTKRPSGAKAL